jgi:integrase
MYSLVHPHVLESVYRPYIKPYIELEMAKSINRLTARTVINTKKPGWYPDGAGLYLQVASPTSKTWVYRYQINGKERRHGLGSYDKNDHTLEWARREVERCKEIRNEGHDPIDYKRAQKLEKNLEEAKSTTFKECALAYIESHKRGWKNAKHESQWRNTLETYAYPVIGDLGVQDIDIGLVMDVLEPIWYQKTETASRVRQRIENILDWATVKKYRSGDNPALWRGRLDKLLPKRTKVQKPVHFAAMDYRDVPEYFQSLRKRDSVATRALAFTILTAARNGEARAVTTDEIDGSAKVWVIPDSRMKADREHRVPLSPEALKILKEMEPFQRHTDNYIFPGQARDKPISEASLLKVVKQNDSTLTVHGFRSSFRDWCAEQTSFPREVAEAALAHSVKDKTEAAYQRGDLFEKRRILMDHWAQYCLKGVGTTKVVPIRENAK